jgi:hypothetical protein
MSWLSEAIKYLKLKQEAKKMADTANKTAPAKAPVAAAGAETASTGIAGVIATAVVSTVADKSPELMTPAVQSAAFVILTAIVSGLMKWFRKARENKKAE